MTDVTNRTGDPDDYPFDLHDLVKILGSTVEGRVAAVTFSKYHEARYAVEYVDAMGSPQQGEWFHGQLELVQSADEEEAVGEELPDNVVPLRRVH